MSSQGDTAVEAVRIELQGIKLSGRMRRNRDKLVKQRYDEDVATWMIKAEAKEIKKRKLEEEPAKEWTKKPRAASSPAAAGAVAEVARTGPSYADVAKKRCLVICNEEYPLNPLTTEQMDAIMCEFSRILQTPKPQGGLKPAFTRSVYKAGYISIIGLNDECLPWLIDFIPQMNFNVCGLKVVKEEELPHPLRAVAYFPNAAGILTEGIMTILDNQNHGFNFKAWRQFRRVNRRTNAMLIWCIDSMSGARLTETGGKISFLEKPGRHKVQN